MTDADLLRIAREIAPCRYCKEAGSDSCNFCNGRVMPIEKHALRAALQAEFDRGWREAQDRIKQDGGSSV